MKNLVYIAIVLIISFSSCKNKEKMIAPTDKLPESPMVSATATAIVYNTYKDFSNLVPVIMDAGKTKILSYPAPSDIFYNGKLAIPTALKNGYWLDNRGINENVAFLNYTYEAYSQLKEAPSLSEMMTNIAEKYPLTELVYCGSRSQFKNEVADLNSLIDKGFPNCRKADIVPMAVEF